jgi:hypothetical protein
MTENGNTSNGAVPNLHRRLFWDWRFDAIDWQASYVSIIARVVERGTADEIQELIRFYGEEKVDFALRKEIVYLPDYVVKKVTEYFGMREDELACYGRKLLRRGHWI